MAGFARPRCAARDQRGEFARISRRILHRDEIRVLVGELESLIRAYIDRVRGGVVVEHHRQRSRAEHCFEVRSVFAPRSLVNIRRKDHATAHANALGGLDLLDGLAGGSCGNRGKSVACRAIAALAGGGDGAPTFDALIEGKRLPFAQRARPHRARAARVQHAMGEVRQLGRAERAIVAQWGDERGDDTAKRCADRVCIGHVGKIAAVQAGAVCCARAEEPPHRPIHRQPH